MLILALAARGGIGLRYLETALGGHRSFPAIDTTADIFSTTFGVPSPFFLRGALKRFGTVFLVRPPCLISRTVLRRNSPPLASGQIRNAPSIRMISKLNPFPFLIGTTFPLMRITGYRTVCKPNQRYWAAKSSVSIIPVRSQIVMNFIGSPLLCEKTRSAMTMPLIVTTWPM